MPQYPCAVCGTEIEMPWAWRKKHRYVFCSPQCRQTPFIPCECANCHAEFLIVARAVNGAKFCSDKCKLESSRKKYATNKGPLVSLTCQQCGTTFQVRRSYKDKQLYCSQSCSGQAIALKSTGKPLKPRHAVTCAYCGKTFDVQPSRYGRGLQQYCCNHHRIIGNLKRLASGARTNIEIAMDLMLKRNHIAHLEQVVMFDKFMVDFLLTDYPIVIQCDGAYWHNRPKVKSRDKGQDAYLVKAGYTVLRFDERQILHSPRECIKSIKSAIKTPSQPRLIHY